MPSKRVHELKIGFVPFDTGNNAYIARMKEIMGRLGQVVPFPTPRKFFLNPLALFWGRFDCVVLNWIESIAINEAGNFSYIRSSVLFTYLVVVRILTRKIIWVKHNNYPHGTAPGSVEKLKWLLRLIERFADEVVTHSGHNAGGKIRYVPHPLYRSRLRENAELPFDNYYFIFGYILPYKKLHEAIELIPESAKLVIAGPAPDTAYLEYCQHLANGKKNIFLLPGYLHDSIASDIALRSNGLVVLNAEEDMIVSGNYFFAFSLGVPIFTVVTPFINWLANERNMAGINAFPSTRELLYALAETHEPSQSNLANIEAEFGDAIIIRAFTDILRF